MITKKSGPTLLMVLCLGGVYQLCAYTITVHNRTPYKLKIKFDHAASKDNHKDVEANSTYALNSGAKCTRGIEIEDVYNDDAKAYKGLRKDNPGGNCRSQVYWITRNQDIEKALETR